MSWKIVKQNSRGQNKTTVSNGWNSENAAWERCAEIEHERSKSINNDELRNGSYEEFYSVEKG